MKRTILLVEDNLLFAKLIQDRLLEEFDITLLCATTYKLNFRTKYLQEISLNHHIYHL